MSRPTSTALNEAWLLRGQIDTVRKAASPKDTLEQHTAETTLEKPKQTVQRDTLAQQAQSDTLAKKDSLSSRLRPELVALGAALLPGFGQIYNQAYWKLPILYGLLGWFGYNFFTQHQLYLEFRDRYNSDLEQRPIPPSAEANRRFREFYREQRDEFGVYILLVYLASIVDAYVDAHLYGFDISDDLSQRVPVAMPTVPIFTIKLRF
ncbi:MAG: DUF5683 domain-containing protein [Chloroherpetonaceae bacterium]|nr:DUF5683 domain-containing protein [Chloroherpetonaceae bacterium]